MRKLIGRLLWWFIKPFPDYTLDRFLSVIAYAALAQIDDAGNIIVKPKRRITPSKKPKPVVKKSLTTKRGKDGRYVSQ